MSIRYTLRHNIPASKLEQEDVNDSSTWNLDLLRKHELAETDDYDVVYRQHDGKVVSWAEAATQQSQAILEEVQGISADIDEQVQAVEAQLEDVTAAAEVLTQEAEEANEAAEQAVAQAEQAVDGASLSASNALASATLAREWATKTDGLVDNNDYSAKYYASLAATSESNASTSETNAQSYANTAVSAKNDAVSAKNDAVSAKNTAQTAQGLAEGAATSAGASATLAEKWATKTDATVDGTSYGAKYYAQDAADSASTATTKATAASNFADEAKDWANKTGSTVDGSEYSAKHYAGQASTSATNAATSEGNASGSASAASGSATLAEDWATKTSGTVDGTEYSSKHYAGLAATSATNAATSEGNASGSASDASGYATAANNAKTAAEAARDDIYNMRDYYGLPIGYEYFTTNPNIPQGSLPLFGGEYSRETYSALWDWVQTQTGYLITDTAWQALSNSQNGNVPYYSDGDGSTTFRVPSLKCWVKSANGTVSEVGSYLAAGLPNISGDYTLRKSGASGHTIGSTSGSFSIENTNTSFSALAYQSGSEATADKVLFNASSSNSIYGNSTTVQPESIVGMWLVKAYGTVVDTGTIDEQAYMDDRFNASKQYTNDSVTDLKNTYLPANYLPSSGGRMMGDIITKPSVFNSSWDLLETATTVTNRYGTKGTIPTGAVYLPLGTARDESDYISNESKCRYAQIESAVFSDGGTNLVLVNYQNVEDGTNLIKLTLDYPPSGQTNLNFNGQQVKFPAMWTSSVDLLVRPTTNGTINLGNGSYRWKQLFATTTTISTSDERQKENITSVPDNVLDAWGEVQWYQFQFKDAIAEKGENARIHNGVIAQRIKSVFESHGLDAFRYGLLCYDEWDAVPAEYDQATGEMITPALEAGNQYSLRYEEALCMEAAYQRRRADRLEARIEALERAING